MCASDLYTIRWHNDGVRLFIDRADVKTVGSFVGRVLRGVPRFMSSNRWKIRPIAYCPSENRAQRESSGWVPPNRIVFGLKFTRISLRIVPWLRVKDYRKIRRDNVQKSVLYRTLAISTAVVFCRSQPLWVEIFKRNRGKRSRDGALAYYKTNSTQRVTHTSLRPIVHVVNVKKIN